MITLKILVGIFVVGLVLVLFWLLGIGGAYLTNRKDYEIYTMKPISIAPPIFEGFWYLIVLVVIGTIGYFIGNAIIPYCSL